MICLCPPVDIEKAWVFVYPLLQEAVERSLGRDTESALKQMLIDGHYQLWMAGEPGRLSACCATRVAEYPSGKKVLNIVALGGKQFEQWAQELLDTLKKFSLENKCTSIEFVGRRGWMRKLPEYGFEDCRLTAMEYKL